MNALAAWDINTVAQILALSPSFYKNPWDAWRPHQENASILADMLPGVVMALMHTPRDAYKRIELPKKSGGTRVIHAPLWEAVMVLDHEGQPYSQLQVIQKRIHTIISALPLPRNICAFRPWISPYRSLRQILQDVSVEPVGVAHPYPRARQVGGMYSIDIKDFFNSITADQVRAVWINCLARLHITPASSAVIDILTLLSCYQERLNQGPPSSPAIANMVGHMTIESQLTGIERTRGTPHNPQWIRYLRYADDIIVLSFDGSVPGDVPDRIGQSITKAGFEIAPKKTQLINDVPSYPVLGISVLREKWADGLCFQIGAARDRELAQKLMSFWGDPKERLSLRGGLSFNTHICSVWGTGNPIAGYTWCYSPRVGHALEKNREALQHLGL